MLPFYIGLGILVALFCAAVWELLGWWAERPARLVEQRQELVTTRVRDFTGRMHIIIQKR